MLNRIAFQLQMPGRRHSFGRVLSEHPQPFPTRLDDLECAASPLRSASSDATVSVRTIFHGT
jgi:hypothetical protein